MVKQTHGGRYGYTVDQGPDANQRRLTVRSAIPSEYLRRQGLMKVAFGDQLSLVAIVTDPYHKSDPAIVIEQTHVNGTHDATDASITAFMQSAGFTRLDDRLIDTHELPDGVWYRSSDHLLVADANASNFVRLLNSEQIIPIDLVVTQYPPELIAEIEKLTALGTTSTAPHPPRKTSQSVVLIPYFNPTFMPLVTPEQMIEIVRNQPPPSSRKESPVERVRRHHREIAARGVQLPQRKPNGKG